MTPSRLKLTTCNGSIFTHNSLNSNCKINIYMIIDIFKQFGYQPCQYSSDQQWCPYITISINRTYIKRSHNHTYLVYQACCIPLIGYQVEAICGLPDIWMLITYTAVRPLNFGRIGVIKSLFWNNCALFRYNTQDIALMAVKWPHVVWIKSYRGPFH